MPTLTDPIILAIQSVLANWNVTGYVDWADLPFAWLKRNLASLRERDVNRLMWEHVRQGGAIDQIRETRPEWNDHDYHYDFRLSIAGRTVYIETRLHNDDPEDPTLEVVNIHDV